jgi:hypothetical protein
MQEYGEPAYSSRRSQPCYSQPMGSSQQNIQMAGQPQFSQSGSYSQPSEGSSVRYSHTSGGSLPVHSQFSEGSLMGSSQASLRSIPDMSQTHGRSLPDMSQTYIRPLPSMSQTYGRSLPDMSQTLGRLLPDMSQTYGRSLPDMSSQLSQAQRGSGRAVTLGDRLRQGGAAGGGGQHRWGSLASGGRRLPVIGRPQPTWINPSASGAVLRIHVPGNINQCCARSRQECQAFAPVADFNESDWGYKVNSGLGLSYSYRPARLHGLTAGRYDNPMPELNLSSSHGSMTSPTGIVVLCIWDELSGSFRIRT